MTYYTYDPRDPANRRDDHWERSCGRKSRFHTQEEAEQYVARRKAKYGDNLRSYDCLYCKGWHLTTVKKEG